MQSTAALGIICKTPQSGKAKTRLKRSFGRPEAAELSSAVIRDVAGAIEAVQGLVGGPAPATLRRAPAPAGEPPGPPVGALGTPPALEPSMTHPATPSEPSANTPRATTRQRGTTRIAAW